MNDYIRKKYISPDAVENYGVFAQDQNRSECDEVAEQVRRVGFALLDSGYTVEEMCLISEAFNDTRANYIKNFSEARLRMAGDLHTIRAPLTHGGPEFFRLATNSNLLNVIGKLISGKFILNQQNGIINPTGEISSNTRWHRDLPWTHNVFSSPLGVSALYFVDDSTEENGATFVLPGTHTTANLPSREYVRRNALAVPAKRGQYLVFDAMTFHTGGSNLSEKDRRSVNHLYTTPYFKQQVRLPDLLSDFELSDGVKELLGFKWKEASSIDQYLIDRTRKRSIFK